MNFIIALFRFMLTVTRGAAMGSLIELLEEYDRLGSEGSAHDFVLRQRRLEDWAAKARDAIAALARTGSEAQPGEGESAEPRSRAPTEV